MTPSSKDEFFSQYGTATEETPRNGCDRGGTPPPGDPQDHERALRGAARRAILAGTMPAAHAQRIWGGTGIGAPCAVCSEPLARDSVELEIEFDPLDGVGDVSSRHLHVPCFAAWESECRLFVAAVRAAGGTGLPAANAHGNIPARERDTPTDGAGPE